VPIFVGRDVPRLCIFSQLHDIFLSMATYLLHLQCGNGSRRRGGILLTRLVLGFPSCLILGMLGMCYILCMTSFSVNYVAQGGRRGLRALPSRNVFFLRKHVKFCLIFFVALIFMSIVGQFFGTWFMPMVFYFWLRN
jgi:hypothetical protein